MYHNYEIIIPDEILIHILQYLSFSILNSVSLRIVSKHFSNLRRFAVTEIIINDEIRRMNSHELSHFLAQFPYLKRLEPIEYRGYAINDFVITTMDRFCPHLSHLGMCNCHQINDDTMRLIYGNRSSTCLNTLNLAGCNRISNDGLKYLTPSIENLVLTACDDFTDDGMYHVANQCHHLKRLHLSFLDQITADGIRAIIKENGMSLEVLDIAECVQVNDSVLNDEYGGRGLLYYAKQLREINIQGCPLISDQGIESLTQIRTLERVKCKRYGINEGLKTRLRQNNRIEFIFR
eukprot:gb/GECH01008684.1/.p1 GENE.gb/GECH01008684.1/~~gb/GECH01008684.1/.p1  ORF type:complete len:292 (+),score=47.81 gb/GECH01008684.1/:1-876(+)